MELEETYVESNVLVTVASNRDFESFPRNSGSHFSSQLIRPLVGTYKVALLSITFQLDTSSENRVDVSTNVTATTDDIAELEEDQVTPAAFFDSSKNEDQVTLVRTAEVIVQTINHYTSVLPFMDEINSSMREVNASFTLEPVIHDKGIFTRLTYNDSLAPGFEAVLPEGLAKALGFGTMTHFNPGAHTSSEICDDAIFTQHYDINAVVAIYFAGYKTELIKIEQPASDNVHDVVEELQNALSEHSIGVGLDDNILHIRIYEDFYSLRLSSKLNSYFGAESSFELKDPDNVLFLPKKLFEEREKGEDAGEINRHNSLSSKPINKIFIVLNIVRAQQVGTKYIPYIQVIDTPSDDKIITHRFDHPVYIEADRGEISVITISLKTESNEDVRTGTNPTVAVLHFSTI